MVVIAEHLQQRDIRTGSAIDNQVIEYLELFCRPGRKAHNLLLLSTGVLRGVGRAALKRIPAILVHLAHKDISARPTDSLALSMALDNQRLVRGDSTVYRASKSHTQVDSDAVVDHAVHRLAIVGKVKVCEETKRSKSEWENWWYDLLAESQSSRYWYLQEP